MVARVPIGPEAGLGGKIDRRLFDVVPMLAVELSVPPLQAGAFEKAQGGTGKE